MQLVISNTLSGERWIEDLDKSEITVGRPPRDAEHEAPDILLPSRLVSSLHARLREGDDGWGLEHVGRVNDTFLSSQPINTGRLYPLQKDDEIKIGEFVLVLKDQTQSVLDPASGKPKNPLVELERAVHSQLIDRMDLRRTGAHTDLDSDDTRGRIIDHLDTVLGIALNSTDEAEMQDIFRNAVYRRLSRKITAAGSDAAHNKSWQADIANAPYETLMSGIEARIVRELGVTFEPKQLEEDSNRLDSGFDAVIKGYELEFNPGLKDYLVRDLVKRDILDLVFGLGPLQDLLEMEGISEVMVVSKDQIFIEKFGVVEDSRRSFFSDEMLLAVIERIVSPVGRRIDRSSPIVDARLPDGSRVNAVIPPLAVKGPCITIRKFSRVPLEMEDLIKFGAISEQTSKFLRACVVNRKNTVVSGGTGTGKTTLLNCLSSYITAKERVVTIEDTAELQLKQNHVVTLESRPANMEGKGAITIRDLVKNALRMRPDRIIVGECRGGETLDMLQAMNTGHDGSMTTAHANSPADMMLRLETMVLTGTAMPISAIRDQIVSAIDIVVQLTRFGDGARRVTHVSEVIGVDEDSGDIVVEDIFVYHELADGGRYSHTGYIPTFIEEILDKGNVGIETFF